KVLRRARRIDHAVARHAEPAGESWPEVRLSFRERLCVENLRLHTTLCIKPLFTSRFRHLLVVSSDPDRAARIVFNLARQLITDLVPELLRITRERKLRIRIVHHDEMAHARRSRTTTHDPRFNDRDSQPFARALRRTRGSDNPRADNDRVESFRTHLPMPMAKGSRASRIRSASAVIKAEPLIRGCTTLSTTLIDPSKTLPTILSCFHTSPSFSFPSAKRHASLALVPV